jgi:hypothetical protein
MLAVTTSRWQPDGLLGNGTFQRHSDSGLLYGILVHTPSCHATVRRKVPFDLGCTLFALQKVLLTNA